MIGVPSVRSHQFSAFALAMLMLAGFTLGGCAPKVLVKDFRLDNTTIGISEGNPLNVSVGVTPLERSPTKEETDACIKRTNSFVNEITAPLTRKLTDELKNSHVKVVNHASSYRMVKFIRGMRPNIKSDAKSDALLKALKAQEDASGKADEQPDMLLNVFFRQILASPGRNGRKDHYMIFLQASVVTITGPGAGMGPVWKTSFRVDAQPDRENNDAVIDGITSRVLNGLKASKMIAS